jgi:hypothetical protein
MPQPTVSDVHVNVPLTNMSIAYIQSQDAFKAAEIFPMIPVQKISDKYFYYTKDYFFTNEAKIRVDGTESEGTGYGIDSSNSYSCDVYSLHKDLGDMVMQNADSPLNMQRDATLFLTQKLLLAREKEFVDTFFNAAAWTTTSSAAATNEVDGCAHSSLTAGYGTPETAICYWDDYTYSTPIKDMRHYKMAMAQQTGFTPNTLVLGPLVFEMLCQHPDILERVKYGGAPGNPAVVTEQALAQVLGIDRVVVPMAVLNSSLEGTAAPSYDFLYGKHALLVYSNPSPSLLTPSAGYTFGWQGYLQGSGMGGAGGWFAVRDFRLEWRRAMRVEAEMAMDMKLIAQDLGLFMDGVIS